MLSEASFLKFFGAVHFLLIIIAYSFILQEAGLGNTHGMEKTLKCSQYSCLLADVTRCAVSHSVTQRGCLQ